jgi:hypothetical protein
MKAIKINKFIFSIVFKRLFNKGNRKYFFTCSYRVYRNTCESLGETRNSVETLALRAISRFSQTFTRVFITP